MKKWITGVVMTVGTWAPAALADAPDSFSIKSLVYAGSGCPAGSVAENVSPDNQAFTLLFDGYFAEAGPGVPLSASRKNCQVLVQFDCPAGWKYSIMTVDTRGYVALERGVKGIVTTSAYVQGSAATTVVDEVLVGEIDENYFLRAVVPAGGRRWGTCGRHARALNINTAIRVDNLRARNKQGLMTADSIDGAMVQEFGLTWERETF